MNDVVVIGAGAAGLMAAAEAAQRGRSVVLLEKNQQAGLKILISGGGRCNLTTTRSGKDLESQYGRRRGRWLRHALRSFPPRALVELTESLGVALHEEDLEKIFPVSRKARDVRDAFVRRAEDLGVEIRYESPVDAVQAISEGFRVSLMGAQPALDASAVILATGGLSYPKTGATGDGYAIARHFGHTVGACVPALAPLALRVEWLNALQGLVLDAGVAVLGEDGKPVVERRRPTLITHRGLSGPAPMDVSGFVEEREGAVPLRLDLAPDRRADELEADLVAAARSSGRKLVQHLLPEHLPERLRVALCAQQGLGDCAASALPKAGRKRLVESLKDLRFDVEHSLGFGAAEVTRGGVELSEVDAATMESKRQAGLFFCGEVLDIDGPIGGFNFQAAFGTGRLAGLHA